MADELRSVETVEFLRGDLQYEIWDTNAGVSFYLPDFLIWLQNVPVNRKSHSTIILDWAEDEVGKILALGKDATTITTTQVEFLKNILSHFSLGTYIEEKIKDVIEVFDRGTSESEDEDEETIFVELSCSDARDLLSVLEAAKDEGFFCEGVIGTAIAEIKAELREESSPEPGTLDEKFGEDKADILRSAYDAGLSSEDIFKLKNALYTHPELTRDEWNEAEEITRLIEDERPIERPTSSGQKIIEETRRFMNKPDFEKNPGFRESNMIPGYPRIIEDSRVPKGYGFLFSGHVYQDE